MSILIITFVFILMSWSNLISTLLLDPLKGVTWVFILTFVTMSFAMAIVAMMGGGIGSYCLGFRSVNHQVSPSFYIGFIRSWLGFWLDALLFPVSFIIFLFTGRFLGDILAGLSYKRISSRGLVGCVLFFGAILLVGFLNISSFLGFKYRLGLVVPIQARDDFIEHAVRVSPVVLNYWTRLMGVISNKELCLTGVAASNANVLNVCLEVDKDNKLGEAGRRFIYSNFHLWCGKSKVSICDIYLDRLWRFIEDGDSEGEYTSYFLKTLVSLKGLPSYNTVFNKYVAKVRSLDLKELKMPTARRVYMYLRELLEYEEYLNVLLYWEKHVREDNAWLYFAIGEAYYLKQKHDNAKAYFSKAIAIDKNYKEKVKLYYSDWE